MNVTRKGFIQILLTTVSTAVVGGCGDSAGGAGGSGSTTTATGATATTGAGGGCGATGAAIAANHGHVLTIATTDLDSAADKTYSIQGAAPHDHTVTFTPANLAALKAKMPVSVTSTTTNVHSHMVTATCV